MSGAPQLWVRDREGHVGPGGGSELQANRGVGYQEMCVDWN